MKTWFKSLAIFFVINATSISYAQTIKLTPLEKSSAEEAVKLELRDPDSAKFNWQTFFPADKNAGTRKSACATVNAKNGFGGYTGGKMFYAVFEGGKVYKIVWMTEIFGVSCK